jgi:hypothetical protein
MLAIQEKTAILERLHANGREHTTAGPFAERLYKIPGEAFCHLCGEVVAINKMGIAEWLRLPYVCTACMKDLRLEKGDL